MKKLLLLTYLSSFFAFSQQVKIDTTKVEKLDTVLISSVSQNKTKDARADVTVFSQKDIESAPMILGESDPVKTIQLSAGVQRGAEGQSSFLVRGGNGSMNSFYLDDIYIHNTSHLGGIFTSLNSDYIKKMSFYKGGFEAEDGGRLASITKIEIKDGLTDEYVKGNVGLLSAKLTTSFKLEKLNTSVLVSGRRTYLELISAFMGDGNSILGDGKNYFFYDYLIKTNTRIGENHSISFTNYNTKDDFTDQSEEKDLSFGWQNHLLGFNWKYRISDRLKNKLTLSTSDFKVANETTDYPYNYAFNSKFKVSNIKNVLVLDLPKHQIKTGFSIDVISNLAKNVTADILGETQIAIVNPDKDEIIDQSIFIDDLWQISDKLKLKTGVRLTNYKLKKPSSFKKWYVEPRMSMHYQLKEDHALKFSYQSLRQYLHQATVNTFSLPLDYFIPTNEELPFQKSNQFSTGYYFDKFNFKGEISAYYKNVNNYSEFRNGALNNLFNNDLYQDVVTGKLQSYGIETHIEGYYKKLKGSLNYTFSKTRARFDEINNGKSFSTVFDRPHNLNIIFNYQWNKKLSINSLFTLSSGQNYTPIKDLRVVNEFLVLNYDERNSARFPNYHRLDIGVSYILKQKKNYTSTLNFTVYNLYNQANPFYIENVVEGSIEEGFFSINSSFQNLFPVLPSLSWNFKF